MSPTRSLSALAGCWIFALAALGASSASAEVSHATGNFYEAEVDYEHMSDPALTLSRTYNSKQALVSDLGPGWSMTYVTERLVVSRHPGTIVETYGPYTRVVQPTFTTEIYYQSKSYERTGRAVLQQPDGKTRNLTTEGTIWRAPGERQTQIDCVQPHSAQINPGLGSAPAYGLVSVAHNVTACGAFVVRSADGTVKTYTQTGGAAGLVYLLTAVQLDGGWAATLTYNQTGQLVSVTSSFGRALQFTYTAGKLTQLNGPGGYQVQYAYNSDGSLASATKPAGSGRQYTYQLGRCLTHIRDSAGGLRRQITYDASNRATRVERQGGVGAYTFAYNTDGGTTVTNPNGLAATYQFASIGGARRLMSVSNPGCGCPSTTSQYSYDDNGAIVSAGDFNGASTSYARDEFGRELSRYDSEGQVTETAWAPILNRKTRVAQAGVETTFEYDTAGNVVTRTETSSAGIRTWTYTYNGPLLTAVSGPGTQYNETYTYNAQGDLTSIVNAKGHATQITNTPTTLVEPVASGSSRMPGPVVRRPTRHTKTTLRSQPTCPRSNWWIAVS